MGVGARECFQARFFSMIPGTSSYCFPFLLLKLTVGKYNAPVIPALTHNGTCVFVRLWNQIGDHLLSEVHKCGGEHGGGGGGAKHLGQVICSISNSPPLGTSVKFGWLSGNNTLITHYTTQKRTIHQLLLQR